MTVAIVVAIVVVIVVIGYVVSRRRSDPVDSFRRQIDALSPEARRPTIHRVKAAEDEEPDAEPDDGSTDDEEDTDGT